MPQQKKSALVVWWCEGVTPGWPESGLVAQFVVWQLIGQLFGESQISLRSPLLRQQWRSRRLDSLRPNLFAAPFAHTRLLARTQANFVGSLDKKKSAPSISHRRSRDWRELGTDHDKWDALIQASGNLPAAPRKPWESDCINTDIDVRHDRIPKIPNLNRKDVCDFNRNDANHDPSDQWTAECGLGKVSWYFLFCSPRDILGPYV